MTAPEICNLDKILQLKQILTFQFSTRFIRENKHEPRGKLKPNIFKKCEIYQNLNFKK